jgi:glycerophosphoryl diester phosphodiesterase
VIQVAHAIKTLKDAEEAVKFGCSLLEVDISQNIINGTFVIQHSGIKGKFGIGKNIDDLLSSKFRNKLVLDLKHAKYSLNYQKKINNLFKEDKIKNAKITGIDLKIISEIARENNAEVYYGFLNDKSIKLFFNNLPYLYKPSGFSIKSELINQDLIKKLKAKFPKARIWAWTVNDQAETKRLEKLKVDGIITDLWKG